MVRIGIDVGSTTAKMVALDEGGKVVFSRYARHNAKAVETVTGFLEALVGEVGDLEAHVSVTGSVGMGLSERCSLAFTQEVVAAARTLQAFHPGVRSMIDIGGEDAKVVFLSGGKPVDLRMNGNCAGGTGAFIDQMAVILGVGVAELDALARASTRTYPIASRCGVFCKTDIQNLLSSNVCREDIAASIFHAVAVQTVVTLAHGFDMAPPLLFCGGPLTFIPSLRKAFIDYLSLGPGDVVVPGDGALLPAIGAALSSGDSECGRISSFISRLALSAGKRDFGPASPMGPLFADGGEYAAWRERMSGNAIARAGLTEGPLEAFLGIDSGSTTTKLVLLDGRKRMLFSHYRNNGGNPIGAVEEGLESLRRECEAAGTDLRILGGCSTGYGEDLVRAAFRLHSGLVETMAHFLAARHFDPEVSFILDIGGQDMKAVFIDGGVIDRIEINEACSSGCGSFMETFARTLGYTPAEFSRLGCGARHPSDLGTRCTVFMNSKVKQALREGATIGDIAAGLAVSVVKNCLYKVLKLKDVSSLGGHVVVQGGTMRADSVVRALEMLTSARVSRSDVPELMGAFGCALWAMEHRGEPLCLGDMMGQARHTSRALNCRGCQNNCAVTRYRFGNGGTYFSGNKCERVFTNGGGGVARGANAYAFKNELLFNRNSPGGDSMVLGIPRVLNMFEEYPFWHALFSECGIRTMLSSPSVMDAYEGTARMVMSDNLCFPAKLVHGHVNDLIERKADRVFLPFVVHEIDQGEQNSYNCPVVTGYSAVVKSVQRSPVPVDSPVISFKSRKLLMRQCEEYLAGLGVAPARARRAFAAAERAMAEYAGAIAARNEEILGEARRQGRLTVLLAGRPYHADPLIQHDVAEMIADLGVDVITDDIVRGMEPMGDASRNFISQWAFPNRILKAALWSALQGRDVQFVQMTSFGCGPDAFLTDEVRDLLLRHGKPLTLLKLDDISNVGSMKLRVRSLVESLRMGNRDSLAPGAPGEQPTTAVFGKGDRSRRKILIPFFTPFLSPLIPAILETYGYDVENLPLSDTESSEWGLRYANNEVCYPATLIVGDVVKAFRSGRHDPRDCAVAITQTGGQCRASNYVALIKKALTDAGYSGVPVVTLTFGVSLGNEQPGFTVNWARLLPLAIRAVLYSDCLSKFYYASVVREREPGLAARLKDSYMELGASLIRAGRASELYGHLGRAALEFNAACLDRECPKVGVVGEIFLKFNPFSHKNVVDWLIGKGVEVVPPIMTDFFIQAFVNKKVNVKSHVEARGAWDFLYDFGYGLVRRQIAKVNAIGTAFRHFVPFGDIFEEAARAGEIITLSAQFGEGWLLPGDIMSLAASGVGNVISLQPFGCIANHIISRGVERRIKEFYPDMNFLSLDFDSGVSDVNVTNRMLLFLENLK